MIQNCRIFVAFFLLLVADCCAYLLSGRRAIVLYNGGTKTTRVLRSRKKENICFEKDNSTRKNSQKILTVETHGLTFGQLCGSNILNEIRGCDAQGCGYYGAPRGSRKHVGVDIKCSPGSTVYAPFFSQIIRASFPYKGNTQPYNNGLYIRGNGTLQGYAAKIWYFTPIKTSGKINKGSKLGTSQSLPYTNITQHWLHLQLYKNGRIVDPTVYL